MLQQYPSRCQYKTTTVDTSTNGHNADKIAKRNGHKEKRDKKKPFWGKCSTNNNMDNLT